MRKITLTFYQSILSYLLMLQLQQFSFHVREIRIKLQQLWN
jgi:hypothetical protein